MICIYYIYCAYPRIVKNHFFFLYVFETLEYVCLFIIYSYIVVLNFNYLASETTVRSFYHMKMESDLFKTEHIFYHSIFACFEVLCYLFVYILCIVYIF